MTERGAKWGIGPHSVERNTMSKFIIGEYIQRDDEIIASVLTCESVGGTTIYRVQVEGAFGYDKYVFATEHEWTHYVPHVHLTTRSRDCDGGYISEFTAMPTDEERRSIFGDLRFKRRMISAARWIYGFGGTLDLEGDTFTWYEKTDEGYIRIDGWWCHDCGDADKASSFRDLAAEAAGY